MHHFPIGLDIDWQSPAAFPNLQSALTTWLVDTRSLTERIQSLCSTFEVKLLGQGNSPLHKHECTHLNRPAEEYHVREVVLLADSQPWVFARSIIPVELINGEWRNLGSSPLGKQLFNDNRFARGKFEIARVPTSHFNELEYPVETDEQLYGRRSAFEYNAHRILVAEVFLPKSPAYQWRENA